jgi:transcriptional regulator with XRE-family HTH domain
MARQRTDYATKVGVAIGAIREYLGYTQRDLAGRARTSESTISRYEAGESPRAETLRDLARAMAVPVEFLADPAPTKDDVIVRLATWRAATRQSSTERE